MESQPPLRYIIAGSLSRDFIMTPSGQPVLDIPGGNALYAAAGMAIWENGIGLLARAGSDYPPQWLDQIRRHKLDTRGIHLLSEPADIRRFTAFTPTGETQPDNPVAQFARLGMPYPKELLGYSESTSQLDSRTRLSPLSIRLNDIPSDYLDAGAAHLCPMDYLTHTLLPPSMRQGHITTITLDPSFGYMNPVFWNDIPAILNGLTAFLVSEDKLCNLFEGRTENLWEMTETLAGYGCSLIVVKRGPRGQLLYDGESHHRWVIPAYPAKLCDPTGAGDAFCGGFLAGWRNTYDPLKACLYGNISASITIEGAGFAFAMDAMPGLAEARMQALAERVHKA